MADREPARLDAETVHALARLLEERIRCVETYGAGGCPACHEAEARAFLTRLRQMVDGIEGDDRWAIADPARPAPATRSPRRPRSSAAPTACSPRTSRRPLLPRDRPPRLPQPAAHPCYAAGPAADTHHVPLPSSSVAPSVRSTRLAAPVSGPSGQITDGSCRTGAARLMRKPARSEPRP
jgi:hypothetical protein